MCIEVGGRGCTKEFLRGPRTLTSEGGMLTSVWASRLVFGVNQRTFQTCGGAAECRLSGCCFFVFMGMVFWVNATAQGHCVTARRLGMLCYHPQMDITPARRRHVGRLMWLNRSRLSRPGPVTGSHRVHGQKVNDLLWVCPFSCTPSFVPLQSTSGHLKLLPSTIDEMFEENLDGGLSLK